MLDKISQVMIDPPVPTAASVEANLQVVSAAIAALQAEVAILRDRPYVPPANSLTITVTPNQPVNAQSLNVVGAFDMASGTAAVTAVARETTTLATITLNVSLDSVAKTFSASAPAAAGTYVVTATLTVGSDTAQASTPPMTIANQQADTALVTIPAGGLRADDAQFQRIFGSGVHVIDNIGNLDAKRSGGYEYVVALRFRATRSGAPTFLKIYWSDGSGYAAGTGGVIEMKCYEDDGTSRHLPDLTSTPLFTVTRTPASLSMSGGTYTNPGDRFAADAISGATSLTKGKLYHIVFKNTDGAPETNWSSVDCGVTYKDNGDSERWLAPFEYGALYGTRASPYSGSFTWIDRSQTPTQSGDGSNMLYYTPCFQLGFASGDSIGYFDMAGSNVAGRHIGVTASTPVRERFTPSIPIEFAGVSWRAAKVSGTGGAVIDVLSGSTVLATATIPDPGATWGTATTGGLTYGLLQWFDVALSALVSRTAGQVTDIRFTPQGNSAWKVATEQNGSGYGITYPAAFTQSVAQEYTGSAWQNTYIYSGGAGGGDENHQMVLHLRTSNPVVGGTGGGTGGGGSSGAARPNITDPSIAGNIVFEDDFDGALLNTSKWNTHIWYEPDNGLANYDVTGGNLRMWAKRDSGGLFKTPQRSLPDTINRLIDTDGKFHFTYGVVEARIKFPRGAGPWPGFWLYNHDSSDPLIRPEIDIVEVYTNVAGANVGWGTGGAQGHPNNATFNSYDGPSNNPVRAYNLKKLYNDLYSDYGALPNLDEAFHTFSLVWDETGIEMFFDGQSLGRESTNGYHRSRMYVLVQYWMGGSSGSQSEWDANLLESPANAMLVDYVRVWDLASGVTRIG